MTRTLALLAGALLAIAALAAPSAHAAQIGGDPLLVSSSDGSGAIGIAFAGTRTPEFCCSSVDAQTGVVSPGNAGFNVVLLGDGFASVLGARTGGGEQAEAPIVTGAGTAADPFRLRGAWRYTDSGGRTFLIRQELVYVNGESSVRARHEVVNTSTQPIEFRASMGADLLGGGNDTGRGLFDPGPPRFVGGFNTSVGSVAGLREVTPWDGFEEGQYSSVLARADGDPRAGQSLLDVIDPNLVDNGAAVQWDRHVGNPLQPGGTAGFDVIWQFARTFALTPESATATTGDEAPFLVTLSDLRGRPQAGQKLRWAADGATNKTGTATTDANGRARIKYIGANPGTDVVSVYADLNGNAVHDDEEPRREGTIQWTGPPPPQFAREVNVKPVSGRVLVRFPRRRAGKLIPAGRSRFQPLTEATQFPMGTEIDTSRGRVQLTAARGRRGGLQSLQAYTGRFVVRQPRRGRGLTELRMTGQLRCSSGRRGDTVGASRRRTRRLWARGRGRFRTRGRYSSATVRGTTWFTKDSCRSTTTFVKEGVVVVRDFARRKNIRVRAGRRAVVRARRR